ncbi:hypothetical protein P6F28_00790, partial [Roseicyclus marinus]
TPAALNTQNLAPHSPSAHKRRRKRRRYARVLEPHAEIRQAVPTGRLPFTIQWSGSLALAGRVQDSPEFADDEAIVTSPLVFLDQQRGIARTRSRWYRLGAMQPDTERMRGAFRPDPAAVDAFLRAQLVLLIEAQHLF